MNSGINRLKTGLSWRGIREWLVFILVMTIVGLSSLIDYLFFHSLAEIFSVVILAGTFFIAWNARRFFDNRYLLFIGISFLFVAIIQTLHLLTFKGMDIMAWSEPTNLPTQLWIISRYMLSLSFLAAFLWVKPRMSTGLAFTVYSGVTAILLLSVFYWKFFPVCYIEGQGLSTFKIVSEYIIAVIFIVCIVLLWRKRNEFDKRIFRYLAAGLAVMAVTEIVFTQYINVYGRANLIGHLLMVTSFFLLYKAIIESGLNQPYSLLFRNLKKSEVSLQQRADQLSEINASLLREKNEREQAQKQIEEYRKHLEELVNQRTRELIETNHRLEKEIAEKARIEGELRALSTRTIEALEEERQTISRELHDETGQSLTVLNLLLTNLKRAISQGKSIEPSQIEESQEVVKEVMGQIRALSTNLHPSMLDNIGLVPTLVWYINEFSKRTGIKINFDYSGIEGQLAPRVKLTAYRIIQESLTNITRYAGVDEAFIQLRFNADALQIYVEDEGKGFDLNKTASTSSGIRGMRERAKAMGGNLEISSLPGEGTRLEVTLPTNSAF